MDIREMLAGVREYGYLHTAGKAQPAQVHLGRVRSELAAFVPDMQVLVSGSAQSLPVVPWIAILNPDVTTTAQAGMYVVYLYRVDLSRVYLSMNQGATQHLRGSHGVAAEKAALEELQHESFTIRARLSAAALEGLRTRVHLGAPSRRFLPRGYELGNIAAFEYDTAHLPDNTTLHGDLTRILALYSTCVDLKKEIRATGLELHTAAVVKKVKQQDAPRPPMFRPKSSAEYRVQVKAQTQARSRRHEALIKAFGGWMIDCGLVPATNVHPVDLTVDTDGHHWLIEAKAVKANAELAVREAIGQLFAYRHFYYRDRNRPEPALVAVFSEPVGPAFVELLDSLGIESIWRDGREWNGSAPDVTTSLLKVAQASHPAGK